MKTNFLATITMILLVGIPAAPQTGTSVIRGVVVQAGTGQPLAEAEITLTATGGQPGLVVRVTGPNAPSDLSATITRAITEASAATGQPLAVSNAPPAGPGPFSAVTNATGRFEIANVPPGRYTLTARHEGFVGGAQENGVSPVGASATVNATAGNSLPDFTLTMVRGATVEGRITGPDGRPVSGMTVTPYLFTYREGRPYLVAGGVPRMTDDRGQYRLFWLGPGDYFVAAVPARSATASAPRDSWARTFYPGTIDPAAASPIDIAEGTEFTALNIAIQSVKIFTIKGRALNPLPQVTPRRFPNGDTDTSVPTFALTPRGAAIEENTSPQNQNLVTTEAGRRNGDFEIRGVRPGLYDLFPVTTVLLDGQQRYASGRIPVEVRDRDVEGIVVPVDPGLELRGRIRIAGDASSVKTDGLRVTLRPLDNIPVPIPARVGPQPVDASGTFVIRGVPEALYTLAVTPLPAGAYVADIRQNGASIFDSGIVAGKESPPEIEVIVNADGQTLEGVILDANRQPVSGASIALAPPPNRRQNAALYRAAKSEADGRFKMTGVAPGEYKIFSWKNVPATAWQNAEFLSRYESQGRTVSVKTGTNPEQRVTVINGK